MPTWFLGRVSLFLVLAALLGAAWLQLDLLALCGVDVAEFCTSQEKAFRARQRQEWLRRRVEAIVQRNESREAVMRELLAGRLTLLQAARRFKDLNETPVTCQNDYRSRFPGRSDGEKVCRQVLQWLEGYLLGLPSEQAQTLRRRFADELREHLEHHDGIVVLPE